ncbi:MAG: virulence RhuM family protein [Bifidobacteriaceae bacterium]|nr:virulence RhuM family protein [Bifidobacteriaceae bacterium]
MTGEIVIYQRNGLPEIEARLENETVWLSQQQMASLYNTARTNVVEHIKHIYADKELEEVSTCRNFRQVRMEGEREVAREIPFYNLDMIISLGYRINSKTATAFRQWATIRLKEYIIKGFVVDDYRLKELGGGKYWKELLDRIRDIRSSEKVLYRQVLDLYATSVDYDPKTETTSMFFKTVQNKLHYAVNLHTAAETIFERADSTKDFMGLSTFQGDLPVKSEVTVAKNYLNEDEIFRLNRLVSAFFDLAEIKAQEHIPMTMKDWADELDKFVESYGKGRLLNAGKISKRQAEDKAIQEYKKFQQNTLSSVEKEYLENLKDIEHKAKKRIKS